MALQNGPPVVPNGWRLASRNRSEDRPLHRQERQGWSRALLSCGDVAGFAAVDDRFEVCGKVGVQYGFVTRLFGVQFSEGDQFGNGTATQRFGGVEYSQRAIAVLDHDFRARANVLQKRRDIGCGGFLLRNVDYKLRHTVIIDRKVRPGFRRECATCGMLAGIYSAAGGEWDGDDGESGFV
jgi:hypothetical protein